MLAAHTIEAKGLEYVLEVRISIQRTLLGTLPRLKERGFVVEAGKGNDGLSVFWRIAQAINQTGLGAARRRET